MLVDENILKETDHLTVILKKRGAAARQWKPFSQQCYTKQAKALAPGQGIYGSLFLSSGLNGADLAEPGVYQIQVALHLHGEDVVSNTLQVRVAPPRGYDEDFLAQDFFSEDVGRTLAFNGSLYFEDANDTLREVAEKLSDRRVARHARLALGNPFTRDYKQLALDGGQRDLTSVQDDDGKFKVRRAKPEEARDQLMSALLTDPTQAADTLGHIDFNRQVQQFSEFLAEKGDPQTAAKCLKRLQEVLENRHVLGSVLKEIEQQYKQYAQAKTKSSGTRSRKKK